jgi:hypothetical protein
MSPASAEIVDPKPMNELCGPSAPCIGIVR